MIAYLSPRSGGQRGSILVLTSLILTALVAVAALVVDIGHQSMNKRQLHSIADIAAQDSVSALGISTSSTGVPAAAVASAARNNFLVPGSTSNRLVVELGTWDANANVFTPIGSWDSLTSTYTAANSPAVDPASATAVRVTASTVITYDIMRGSNTLTAQAIATGAEAGVKVGSFAANFSTTQSQELNAVLGGALGNAVNISALGYNGLVGSSVTLNQLAATPTATNLNIGTPTKVANASLTAGQIAQMEAEALTSSGGNAAAISALCTPTPAPPSPSNCTGGLVVAGSGNNQSKFQIGNMGLGVGDGATIDGTLPINALSLATAGPYFSLANGQNFLNLGLNPPLTIAVPLVGTLNVALGLAMIEAPQTKFGPIGTFASTAQIRLQLTVTGCVLQVLGICTETTNIPITMEGFGGTGTIHQIDCTKSPPDVYINGQANAVDAVIGTVDPTKPLAGQTPGSVTLISLVSGGVPLLSGSVNAGLLTGQTVNDLKFSGIFPVPPAVEQRGPQNISVVGAGAGLSSAASGAGTLGGTISLIGTVLQPILNVLDALVINPLLGALGISVVGADIWNPAVPGTTPTGVRCSGIGGVAGHLVQ